MIFSKIKTDIRCVRDVKLGKESLMSKSDVAEGESVSITRQGESGRNVAPYG